MWAKNYLSHLDEKMSLVSLEDALETGESGVQPEWVLTCDEIDFEIGRYSTFNIGIV